MSLFALFDHSFSNYQHVHRKLKKTKFHILYLFFFFNEYVVNQQIYVSLNVFVKIENPVKFCFGYIGIERVVNLDLAPPDNYISVNYLPELGMSGHK